MTANDGWTDWLLRLPAYQWDSLIELMETNDSDVQDGLTLAYDLLR